MSQTKLPPSQLFPSRRTVPCRRRGAMLVLVAFLIGVVLIMAVFSMDVAYMQLTRTELRTATDAAARAASEALSRTQSESDARTAAKAASERNRVAGVPMRIDDADVVFGNAEVVGDTATFAPGPPSPSQFRAVRVLGKRTDSSQTGNVALLMGQVLGTDKFEPVMPATSISLDRDVCLVVDRSGSMNLATDGSYLPAGSDPCVRPNATLSRWAGLRSAYDVFLNEINATRSVEKLALVSYSSAGEFCAITFTESDVEQGLTTDYSAVTTRMNALTNGPIQGWTNITAGVANGINVLSDPATSRPFAKRTMILLTDGLHNQGPPPSTLVSTAVANGIVIHTITYSSDADQVGMQDLANSTEGTHWHAPDAATLIQIVKDIARTLPVVMVE